MAQCHPLRPSLAHCCRSSFLKLGREISPLASEKTTVSKYHFSIAASHLIHLGSFLAILGLAKQLCLAPVSPASSSPCPGILAIYDHTHAQGWEHPETLDQSVPGRVWGCSEPFYLQCIVYTVAPSIPFCLLSGKSHLKGHQWLPNSQTHLLVQSLAFLILKYLSLVAAPLALNLDFLGAFAGEGVHSILS